MGHKPVRIYDSRKVQIDTNEVSRERRPRLYTPAGRTPIAVDWVELTYDIPTATLRSITAGGYLIEERDIERRRQAALGRGRSGGAGVIVRRVSIDWRTHEPQSDVPQWLRDEIEKYRPEHAVTDGGAW